MNALTPYQPAAAGEQHDPRVRSVVVGRGTFGTTFARLELAVASCRGKRRTINEDAHSALDGPAPVYVVADGVGGGAMASRASRELVDCVHRALDDGPIDESSVSGALLDADREVARSIATETDQLGAATVALCAGTDARLASWLIAWVGDCRIYRIAARDQGEPELVTRDDSYRHLAETPPPGSSLDDPARMIGNGAVIAPNLARVDLCNGEMLVLCSDGVHKHLAPRDLGRLLQDAAVPLARRCANLIALARMRGGGDDATALIVCRADADGGTGGADGS